MCNCIEEFKKKVLDQMIEKGNIPKNAEFLDTTMQGEGFALSPNVGTQLFGKVEVEYRKKLTSGKMAKNRSHETMLIMYAYCPICGKPYKEESNAE